MLRNFSLHFMAVRHMYGYLVCVLVTLVYIILPMIKKNYMNGNYVVL